MSDASKWPPLPVAFYQKRRTIEDQPGVHIIFETPTRTCNEVLPTSVFSGVIVRFLAYTENNPVKFRMVVKRHGKQSFPYVEQGVFEGSVITYKTEVKARTKANDFHIIAMSTVAIPPYGQYFWLEFEFSEQNKTKYLINGEFVATQAFANLSELNELIAWGNKDITNTRLFEIHVTHPASSPTTFFRLGNRVNVTGNHNLRPGGRLFIVGKYKTTNTSDNTIKFQVKTGDPAAPVCAIPRPREDAITIVFVRSVRRVVCEAENRRAWMVENYDVNMDTEISLLQNFDITYIRVFTGSSADYDIN